MLCNNEHILYKTFFLAASKRDLQETTTTDSFANASTAAEQESKGGKNVYSFKGQTRVVVLEAFITGSSRVIWINYW